MNNLPKSLASHQHVVIGDAYYFPGMENELYHAIAGSSSSKLRRFRQSQQHAMHEVVEPTPAMSFGSAAHYFIVEGENAFLNNVTVLFGSPYTKAYKEEKARAEQQGKVVITAQQEQQIKDMYDSLLPEAKKYLHPEPEDAPGCFDTPFENALFWYEGETLLKLKADVVRRPLDFPTEKNILIVDYKTTADCSVRGFHHSIRNFQYDYQAAFYARGFERAGFTVTGFAFVAQEKKPPYANKIFVIEPAQLQKRWLQLEHTLGEYRAVVGGLQQPTIYNSPSVVPVDLD